MVVFLLLVSIKTLVSMKSLLMSGFFVEIPLTSHIGMDNRVLNVETFSVCISSGRRGVGAKIPQENKNHGSMSLFVTVL